MQDFHLKEEAFLYRFLCFFCICHKSPRNVMEAEALKMSRKFNWGLFVTLAGFLGGIVLIIINGIALAELGDDLVCLCIGGHCKCLGEGGPILGTLGLGSILALIFGLVLFIFFEPIQKLKAWVGRMREEKKAAKARTDGWIKVEEITEWDE
jgi:hypothetical protein